MALPQGWRLSSRRRVPSLQLEALWGHTEVRHLWFGGAVVGLHASPFMGACPSLWWKDALHPDVLKSRHCQGPE